MIHIEQLYGNWVSKEKYPEHLGKEGYQMKFHLSEPAGGNQGTATVALLDTDATALYSGPAEIVPGEPEEFVILIGDEQIPVRNFANDRFMAGIPAYGIVTFYKSKVLGIRMSF